VVAGLSVLATIAVVLWLTNVSSGGRAPDQAESTTVAQGSTTTPSPGPSTRSASTPPSSAPTSQPASSASHPSSSSSQPPKTTTTSSNPAPAGSHTITIVNADHQTIWAATNPNAQHPIPVTGWQLAPGQSITFAVPKGWGGRVWGRTGCSFSAAGVGHCQTGDCGGVFQCRGTGATPATLAELTFDSFDGLDFYDVSLVDGSNLPMYINTTHRTGPDPVTSDGCYQGACTKPIVCPTAMQVKAGGQVVACTTPCAAFGTDAYCCRGAWAGRQNCDPAKWPVDYAKQVYKDAEPYAYSYAFDDSATMACKGGCDYRIVFGVTPGAR